MSTTQASSELPSPNVVYYFYPPTGPGYVLGWKHGEWYLVFCRAYGMASSREVSRLSALGPKNKLKLDNGHHCFLLDNAGDSWNHSLLKLLLKVQNPPVIAVRGMLSSAWSDEAQYEIEVLLQDGQIAHCCEVCGRWEYGGDQPEWRHREAAPGLYVCERVGVSH
ncbi:hypothetical protein ONZ45_g15947 [Pleurotus djamor]|nr:hypothetical protein ONZ45_g15947 [Pleurotus djamor]